MSLAISGLDIMFRMVLKTIPGKFSHTNMLSVATTNPAYLTCHAKPCKHRVHAVRYPRNLGPAFLVIWFSDDYLILPNPEGLKPEIRKAESFFGVGEIR